MWKQPHFQVACKIWWKSVTDCRLYHSRNHILALFGDFPEFFCARAHCGFTLIFQVSSKSVQVWGTNNQKTRPWLAKVKTRLLWAYNQYKVSTANTHTRTFNSPFSGTTQVSWYQKSKNQSGFYWSKRQWLAVASAGQYKSLHLAPDRQPHQHPTTLFLQARCPSCRPTNSIKALKATEPHNIPGTLPTSEFRAPLISATYFQFVSQTIGIEPTTLPSLMKNLVKIGNKLRA